MPRLVMSDISKRYGATHALRGVDLYLEPGEVHALVGENGAGKSTLMKVLSGAERPDGGSMTLEGAPYAPRGPQDARRRGLGMIYQELNIAPHLTVAENVLLGLEPSRWGILDRREGRRRAREVLSQVGAESLDLDRRAGQLGPAAQQRLEIARALLTDVRVLVFDEPTSSLTQEDARQLFALVRRLRDRGVTVVYISHYLEEVLHVADRLTVLRDGKSVGGGPVSEFTAHRIIELMVGRQLEEQYPRVPHTPGEPLLELRGFNGVDLTLRRGEIFGIAGIVGAGRTELLRSIYGLDGVRSGEVVVRSFSGYARPSVARRIEQGVGMLSEDRKAEGLALPQSIADNLTYTRLRPYLGWLGFLNRGKQAEAAHSWIERLNIRCAGPGQAVGQLSGGNQQKVALGRLLHQDADVLLLDEPTRGIDVGSKAEVYRRMGELAARGKAILFVSSYFPELLGVCDRLAVMCKGRLGTPRPVAEWTPDDILAEATAV